MNFNNESTLVLVDTVIEAMKEKKGNSIVSLDMRHLDNAICSFFVIADAQSSTQVDAIASYVEELVKKQTQDRLLKRFGYQHANWVLLDYGDVVVHVFQTEHREFYQLEELWADAKATAIEEAY